MVVHCSAGIGRSGAFIIIHSVLEKLAAEGKTFNDINLKQLLDMMRTSREGLVTHQLQYNFCYDSIEYSLRYQRIVQEIGTSGFKGKQRQTLQKSPLTRSSQVIPNMAGPDMDLPS
jgi:protein-tyrosine phosphatase